MKRFFLVVLAVLLVGCIGDGGGKSDPVPDDGIEIITESDPLATFENSKTRKAIRGETSDPGAVGPVLAPDPLAAAPPPLSKQRSQPEHYIFAYGGAGVDPRTGRAWCPGYLFDKPKLTGWANERGITVSEANAPNARYAVLQFVDILRDKPQRNLQFDPPNPPLYPTYLVVDRRGGEVWRHVGPLDMGEFDYVWRLIESD